MLVNTPLARGVMEVEAARARGDRDAMEAERPQKDGPNHTAENTATDRRLHGKEAGSGFIAGVGVLL